MTKTKDLKFKILTNNKKNGLKNYSAFSLFPQISSN